MICDPFSVVVVPFPFSDLPHSKRRKALVLSTQEFNRKNGATILMMITSAAHTKWHLDVPVTAWDRAGLRKPCVARAKLFTLDNRLIIDRAGSLTAEDASSVRDALRKIMPLATGDPG